MSIPDPTRDVFHLVPLQTRENRPRILHEETVPSVPCPSCAATGAPALVPMQINISDAKEDIYVIWDVFCPRCSRCFSYWVEA